MVSSQELFPGVIMESFISVQKRVNIAGLRLLSLESPAGEADPWLVSENLDVGRLPTVSRTDKSSSLYKQHGLCCTPALLLGVWNFGT